MNRKISSTPVYKGPSENVKELILKPSTISQPNRSIGSLEEKLEKTKELDFFYDLRAKAVKDLWDKGGRDLKFDNSSADKTIISDINGASKYNELIENFNALETVIGSKVAKKLVVEMLNKVREPQFRESQEGDSIYKAYREFLHNSNINMLEFSGKLVYQENTIQNIVLYLTLGCDDTIVNISSLSQNITNILSCTHIRLDTSIITSDQIAQIGNDLSGSITDATNSTTDEIARIEETKKSYFKKINYGLWKGLKWTLSGNKVLAGLQITLYTAGVGFAGKMVLPIVLGMWSQAKFSDTKSLKDVPDIPSLPDKDEPAVVPDSDTTAPKLFAEFLIKLGEYLINKK